jgi:formamidopyrimidine-DNA glycosylase
MLVESSTKKRASVYLAQGERALAPHAREGLDVITATREEFSEKLQGQSRTLKRALTDPSSFDGIGNAYSDEILFAARLSPTRMTSNLSLEETDRLFKATRETLTAWTRQLSIQYPDFPKPAQITAFRKEFNVHGRFKEPCRVCGAPIQRIVFSENETNYCAQCQNGGKLLADRSLSRLLK